jgi:hypothetical protein
MSFPVAYAPIYVHPVPENHRFPMEKYSLLKEQLVYEGIISPTDLFEPTVIEQCHLVDVHTHAYINRLTNLDCTPREQRVSGFVHCPELIQRELIIMEGTRKCAELVVNGGIAFNIAGGTHHAYRDRGEGFCLLNDQAIASNWLLKNTAVKRILIIDLDVHQGNGTAQIFANEKAVFTFSMHGQSNYPLQKEQSDLAIFNYTKYYKKYKFSVKKKYSSLNKIFTNINDLKLSILSQSGIGTCWNKIYNTSFLKQNNIFFSNYLFEDVIFFYKSILFSKKISIYSKSLYGYLKRPQSLMSTKHKNYSFVFSYYQDIFNFFKTLPNDPFYNDAKNLSLLKLTNKLFKLFKSSSFSNKSSYYIQLKNFIIKNKDYYHLISNKKLKSKIHSILTKNFLLNLIKYGIV